MEKLINLAGDKGFRTVFEKSTDFWIVAFEKKGKWSPPYSGITLKEAAADAMADLKNVKGDK